MLMANPCTKSGFLDLVKHINCHSVGQTWMIFSCSSDAISMTNNTGSDFTPTEKTWTALSKVTKRVYENLSEDALSRTSHIIETQVGCYLEDGDNHVDVNKKPSRFFDPIGPLSDYGGRKSQMINIYCLGQYTNRT